MMKKECLWKWKGMRVLLLINFVFFMLTSINAETAEEALGNYYKYYQEEELSKYYNYLYTSNLNEDEIDARKEVTKNIWKSIDIVEYGLNIINVEESSGKAIIKYELNFRATDGKEEFSHNDVYYAYLINENGWKVKNIFQQEELNELLKQSILLTQEDLIEDINKENNMSYLPLKKTEDMSSISCQTDEECKEKGYYECVDNECVGYSESICFLSIIPFLISVAFAKGGYKIFSS